ncbi:dynamin family protein [Butyrivibrio sp. LC3010]|uniref:dynamin family protein n=1 Tax=Butyrivibrio sp. LC3010 TaxID=1280680 RepID=UPI000412D670|nr:dynamin family protein [Butyrivibrio sp. LC3010]
MAKKKKLAKKAVSEKSITSIVNALQEVRNSEYVKNIDLFENDFQRIIDRLQDESFRLAVVGEFSSGKSTFLNALIGKDLLKHGVKETTATITEIHNKKIERSETYLDVYYLNGKVEKEISADNITDYTATGSSKHEVANEIEKVVINCKILDSDAKVCFVDTPGLNGIADKHREKTIEEIKNAHACIYMMQIRGLGQTDIDFLKYITNYQHNIIFVQNFIDELKELEGETPEQKVQQQKKIIEETIISKNPNIHYEIIPVSARKALIAKSLDFDTYNGESLTEDLRDALYDESCFDDVFNVINNLMDHNEKEKIQQKDAVAVAINLLENLKEVVTFDNDKEIRNWETSIEGRNSENYKRIIEALEDNKQLYIKKLNDYLEAETSEIRKANKKELDEGVQRIEESVKQVFSDINVVSEFENYVKNQLSVYLYQSVTSLDETITKHMNTKLENMVANAVLRIKQYTGTENNSAKYESFEATIIESNVKSFTKEEDEISKLQRELSEKKALDERADKEIQKKRAEISKIDLDIENQKTLIAQENNHKRAEISKLGTMPEKETKYRSETSYEYRGGLGILDAIFGPKEKTISVPYSDYSNQQRWKKKKSDIETKYKEKENQINAQSRMLETQKKQYDDEIKHLERTEAARKQDIKSTQSLLNTKIDYLKNQREKVKLEYLREAKKSMLESIHEYLYESIFEVISENTLSALEENNRRASQVVHSLFEVSFETRIKLLNKKLEQLNGTKTYGDTADLLTLIANCTNKLEGFLCL